MAWPFLAPALFLDDAFVCRQPRPVATFNFHTFAVVCLLCLQEAETDGRGASSRSVYDDEDDAAVSSLKPEMWIKSAGASASTRSMDRPGKADVCSIS